MDLGGRGKAAPGECANTLSLCLSVDGYEYAR